MPPRSWWSRGSSPLRSGQRSARRPPRTASSIRRSAPPSRLPATTATSPCSEASLLGGDERPPGPPSPGKWRSLRLSGRLLSRPPGTVLDLNGVVKSLAVDAALQLTAGDAFVSAGGDVAVRGGSVVGLPGDGTLRLLAGGIATSGKTKRSWRR